MVLYESFHGRGMVCNPYAVFKEILSRPECARMRHVWALADPAEIAAAKEEYGTHANVSFVRYRSRAYLKALCTAGYLVNNVMWDPCFAKREGQAYLNTWHGTALKALGFSTPNGRFNQYNQLKDFLAADYIISGNAHMTEVLRASYKLDGLFPGTLLESGSPRNDALAAPCGRDEALARLARRGVRVDAGKRVVLYAPTWRGRYTDAGPDPAAGDYLAFAAALGKAVGEGCQVLVRPHHVVCRRLEDQGGLPAPFVPAAVDAAEALAAADVLVTDYSSIFFDFLATGRPVLFYTPDLGEYCAERGLCLPLDALPGPRSADVADIAAWVRDTGPVEAAFKQEYEAARRWATGNDDGAAAARAADALLHGRTEGTGAVGGLDAGRERLLVLAGDMRPGPVAESVSALLGSTGYDTADVSVYVRPSQDGACRENVGGIDPRARVLYRSSGYCATPAEALRHRLFGRRSRPGGPSARLAPAAFYRREAARSFGGCGFDRVIDLAGGGGLLAALLPHLPAVHKAAGARREAAS
jgi:CDP-glycerol glycerophosphotransferase (TagB/SpsB family)